MSSLLIISFLYALGYPLSKFVLSTAHPLFLIGIRMVLGGLLLVVCHVIKKRTLHISVPSLFPLCLSGVLCMYLYNALAFSGLATMSATRAAFLDNLAPLMSAFLEWFIFKDRLSTAEWMGLAVATLGTMPIIGATNAAGSSSLSFNIGRGDLVIMLSNIAWVYGFILMRGVSTTSSYDPVLASGISMFVGGVCTLIHSFFTEQWTLVTAPSLVPSGIYVVLMVIVYSGIVDNVYSFLISRYTVTTLMLSGLTVPLFTTFFDWFFFDGQISSAFWLSTVLIGLGLACCFKKKTIADLVRYLFPPKSASTTG